jgi:hypothetical protein
MPVKKNHVRLMCLVAVATVASFSITGAAVAVEHTAATSPEPSVSVPPILGDDWKPKMDFGDQRLCELAGSSGQALRLWDKDDWRCTDGVLWVREEPVR